MPLSSKNLATHDLSLIYFWEQQFSPMTSLLADISHLPITQVKKAIPHLMKVVLLQTTYLINSSKKVSFIEDITRGQILNVSIKDINESILANGIGFSQLKNFPSYIEQARQYIFDDLLHYHRLVGLLSDRTAIPLEKIQTLLDWVVFLDTISLHQLVSSSSISKDDMLDWLIIQPSIGFNAQDKGLLGLFNQRYANNSPSKLLQNSRIAQQQIIARMNDPKHLSLFSLAPLTHNAISNSLSPSSLLAIPPIAQSIFTPTTSKPSITVLLQKYWMLTSIGLTALFFGIISLLVYNKPETPPQAISTLTNNQPIHDVAILKADSPINPAPTTQKPNPNTKKATISKPVTEPKTKTNLEKSKTKTEHDKTLKSNKENTNNPKISLASSKGKNPKDNSNKKPNKTP